VALLTGLLLATSTWHITLSRNGLRAVTLPLIAGLLLYCVGKLAKSSGNLKLIWATFVGVFFSLGFYTYPPFRAYLILLPIVAILSWLSGKAKIGAKPALTAVLLAIICLLPLGLFFMNHPDEAFKRSSQVSTFSKYPFPQSLYEIGKDTLTTITGFFFGLDESFRNNLNKLPYLPYIISLFLPIGLLVSIAKAFKNPLYLIYPAAFAVMLLPAVLTHEGSIPHGMRLVGEIPWIFVITALGLAWTSDRFLRPHINKIYIIAPLSIILGVFAAAQINSSYKSKALASDYRCDLAETANYLKATPTLVSNNVYIVSSTFDRFSLDFYLHNDPTWGFADSSYAQINSQNSGYLKTKFKNLEPANLDEYSLNSGDLLIVPVYGELGFYYLDQDDVIPYGGKEFIKQIHDQYPSLRLLYKHYSKVTSRYPQAISFLVYTL
jgi:hypothetical protein